MKKNNNNITELVFILDRSGSMGGLESDTIGGFNSMLNKQKKEDGRAYVSTVLFDHETEVLHDRVPIEKVPELTDKDYTVRGCTALLDAIGSAIHHIGNVHKYARPEDVPEHTMHGERQQALQRQRDQEEDRKGEKQIRLGVPFHRRKHRRDSYGTQLRYLRGQGC